MPTYDYRCDKCKKAFEYFQKISEPPLKKCPDCGGDVKRLVSAATFALKGGGWYKDGYATKKEEKKEKNEPLRHEGHKEKQKS